jgi:predicted esterase
MTKRTRFTFLLGILAACVLAGNPPSARAGSDPDGDDPRPELVSDLKGLIRRLEAASDNAFFQRHCEAVLSVLNDVMTLTAADSVLLQGMYNAFADSSIPSSPALLSSYLERRRPFIVSWVSPADGELSLAWLIPPEDWDPERTYPLTVRLHGLSEEAYGTKIRYLTRCLVPGGILEASFEGGYTLLPWGRGNLWYHNLGDTDVWESIDVIKSLVRVDPGREVLVGMSMGGYGAWKLAVESPSTWAAVGVFAGALQYDGGRLLTLQAATILKNIPVYIVCGTSDGLLSTNQMAYRLLQLAGNPDIAFATFNGGHEAPLAQWCDMYDWIRDYLEDGSGADGSGRRPFPVSPGLAGNFPNPFNPETRIRCVVPEASDVEIRIYDASGRRVRTLFSGSSPVGIRDVRWDGTGDGGETLPDGVYLCRMTARRNGRPLESPSVLKMCLLR